MVVTVEIVPLDKTGRATHGIAEPFSKWGAQVHDKKIIDNFCGLNRQL